MFTKVNISLYHGINKVDRYETLGNTRTNFILNFILNESTIHLSNALTISQARHNQMQVRVSSFELFHITADFKDFHAQVSLEFAQNGMKNKNTKHRVSHSSVGGNTSVM